MATFALLSSRAVLAAGLAFVSSVASADQALIDYRESVMEAIGGHTSALVSIIKGDVPYVEDAKLHAKAIEPLAKIAEHVFPEESRTGKTEALPAIWEKPAEFKQAMTAFQTAAAQLTNAADGDAKELAGAVSGLGKSCKDCHDNFRKKD